MSIEQKVILTALPGGLQENAQGQSRLRLSVFVSPRLTTTEAAKQPPGTAEQLLELGQYQDFFNWPRTLKNLRFRVTLGNLTLDEPGAVERVAAASEPHWLALFTKSTAVRPYVFDNFSGYVVPSYPARNIETFVKERYGRGATEHAAPTRCSPGVLPRVQYPAVGYLFNPEWFGALTSQSLAAARPLIEQQFATNKAFFLDATTTLDPAVFFLLLADFHSGNNYTKDGPQLTFKEPEVPVFDFHEMVSSLGDYPVIMRRLGLVVDLLLPPQNVAAGGRVKVELLDQTAFGGRVLSPLTSYVFAAGRFDAAPADPQSSELRDGMLRLDDEQLYGLVQVDVDGVALKLMDYVGNAQKASTNPTVDTPQKAALPSLRSAGISLVRTNRAHSLVQSFAQSAHYDELLNQPDPPEVTFGAEDVVRGYRVDVREAQSNGQPAGAWRSLCWRNGTYKFLNNPALDEPSIVDEGIVDTATTDGDTAAAGARPQLKLSEALFRWAGWSLTVPKPICPGDSLFGMENAAKNSFNFRASFALATDNDKLLPRLRYGRAYQFRVRTVDLAGNGLPPGHPSDITTKEAVTYGRFEPVGWPLVVLSEPLVSKSTAGDGTITQTTLPGKEGESVDRLVVRSDFDTDFAAPVPPAERHIAPAKISPDLAETHGLFDKPDGTGLDPNCFKTIAGKDGTLKEVEQVAPGAQLDLPYLPDPLAQGVTFIGLPGGETWQVSFRPGGAKWPELRPFRLRVVGVAANAKVPPPELSEEAGARRLTVRLPQAEIIRVRLSTNLAELNPKNFTKHDKIRAAGQPVLNQLGLWQWIDESVTKQAANGAEAEEWLHLMRIITLAGLHWMITPYRELVFVHAVRRPLTAPELHLTVQKNLLGGLIGVTYANLSGWLKCDAKSTGKLDVLADWEEPRDDPGEPRPHAPSKPTAGDGMDDPITGHAHVLELPLNLPELPFNLDVSNQLTLAHGGKQLATFDRAQGVATLTSPDLRHEFGDTRSRLVNYTAIATTRFREYYPPATVETDAERQAEQAAHARPSQKLSLRIPSSARPAAPKVLYIIPSFRWTKTASGTQRFSQRHGGGLRVYLERGWYSSGDGELLGAVLLPADQMTMSQTVLENSNPLKPYVSQWGADPLRVSAGTNGLLAPQNFTNALTANPTGGDFETTGLLLDELKGAPPAVSVAPHAVAYDPQRQLWYCDIEINPGDSYFPFVRLALARYQPNSLPGVQLSRVVLADFIQLAPDRTVSVAPVAGAQPACTVTVSGASYSLSMGEIDENAGEVPLPGSSEVEVTVERRDVAGGTAVGQSAEDGHYWVPFDTVPLGRDEGNRTWGGRVPLPEFPGASGADRLRLVIKEYEILLDSANRKQNRLVYADVISL